MGALQKTAEVIFITKFKDKSNLVCYNDYYINILLITNLCVIHIKRVTIIEKDIRLIRNIRNKILEFTYPGGQC